MLYLRWQPTDRNQGDLSPHLLSFPCHFPHICHQSQSPCYPQGTLVITNLTSVLHEESQWERPYEFYPAHFLNSRGEFVKPEAFLAFSAGTTLVCSFVLNFIIKRPFCAHRGWWCSWWCMRCWSRSATEGLPGSSWLCQSDLEQETEPQTASDVQVRCLAWQPLPSEWECVCLW